MKRGKYTILVFAITISILVFLLLNLLLGSVAIPFRSVWNILTGGEGDPVAWQNIILKSRLPQALTALVAGAGLSISGLQMQTIFRNPLAGPVRVGYQLGGKSRRGLRGVAFRSTGWGGIKSSRFYRGGCPVDCGYRGSLVGDGADRAGIPESGGERDVVDYRGYDRVYR